MGAKKIVGHPIVITLDCVVKHAGYIAIQIWFLALKTCQLTNGVKTSPSLEQNICGRDL